MSREHPVVLVIDDEEDMREMMAFTLATRGLEPISADGGIAALKAAHERQCDVVVTDLRMPGMDGIETLTALKRLDPDLEVVVATAYASAETAETCRARGAFGCLNKPYTIDALVSMLRAALARRYGLAGGGVASG
jgi:DNA-binding NtrC family response regulator